MAGSVEEAYIDIKPRVSPTFSADINKVIGPALKKAAASANASFKGIGTSSRSAALGVNSLNKSIKTATTSIKSFNVAARSMATANKAVARSSDSAATGMKGYTTAARAAASASRAAAVAMADNAEATRALATALRSVERAQTAAARAQAASADLSRGATQRLGSELSGLGALAKNAAQVAGVAVAGIGFFGVKAAGDLEQTRIAFEGILGDKSVADAFIKRLQKFAAVTPFDFPELAKSTQKLLALGQTGDQAIKTLTTVGNAAAAVGADSVSINRVVIALAQIQAKGKLSAEEINQVGEALPNLNRLKVIENLAKSFGVTTQAVQKLQQKGLIPADAGIAALLKTLDEVPGALGAMDRQSRTLNGRLSTLRDNVRIGLSNAFKTALPAIEKSVSDLANSVGPSLAKLGPQISDLITQLAPVFTQFVASIGPLLGSITTAMVGLAPLFFAAAGAVKSFIDVFAAHPTLLGDAAISIGLFFTALKSYKILVAVVAAVRAFTTTMAAYAAAQGIATFSLEAFTAALLANPIGLIVAGVAALVAAFVLVYRHSETVRFAIKHLKDFALVAFRAITDAVLNLTIVMLKTAAKAASFIPFSDLDDKLNRAAANIEQFKLKVNNSINGIIRGVSINVEIHLSGEQQLFNKSFVQRYAEEVLKQEKALGHTLSAQEKFRLGERLSNEVDTQRKIDKARAAAGSKAPDDHFTLLPDGSTSGASKAASAAAKAAAKVRAALIKLANAAVAAAKKVSDGIKVKLKTAQDALAKLKNQFNDIRDAIIKAFQSSNLFESRSAKQFIKRAAKNIKTNSTVLASQQTLQSRLGGKAGGSDFLKQLFESGNTRLIKNLAAQSSATLADVLAKFNADNALANKIGTAVANAFIVGGKPLVVGIKNVQDQIALLQKELLIALAALERATKARAKLKSAAGGIFSSATDTQVGEAGKEVIVPLTRPSRALELLLQSGALGLPTVVAHLSSLRSRSHAESMARLAALQAKGPSSLQSASRGSGGGAGGLSLVPGVKIVKERAISQVFNIHEAGDAHLTAAKIAARTASHMDR